MINFFNVLIKSDYLKNTITLTLGTSIAQLIPMLFYPILGRIFMPDEFGLLATLTSITSIISVAATLKYDESILITDTKEDAANIIVLVLLISMCILSFSFIILYLFSSQLCLLLNEPLLKNYLFIIPLNGFVIIIYSVYNEWCVRNKYFKNLSLNKIFNSSSTTSCKLIAGSFNIFNNGLIWGDLVGRAMSAFGCVYKVFKYDKLVFKSISIKRINHLAKRFKDFPKYSLPGHLINTIGGQLPVFLIGMFFNTSQIGHYSMTASVLSIPVSIISRAINDTFRQRASHDFRNVGNCRNIYLKTIKVLFFLTSILMLTIFFLPDLFSFILGNKWRAAGEYAQILLPMILLSFLSNALNGVFTVAEKMNVRAYIQIFSFSMILIPFLLGVWIFNDIKGALILMAIGRSLAYLTEIYLSYYYTINRFKRAK